MEKQFIIEAARLQKLANITEARVVPKRGVGAQGFGENTQSLGFLFYPEEVDDGMIEYIYDERNMIEVLKALGYPDAEEVAREIIHVSSPEDELEFMRNKTGDPDMQIEELTLKMFIQGVEEEFEK
jgi:hypothetical protein